MKSRKKKNKYIIINILSVLILIIFLIFELQYLDLILNSNLKNTINNLPINAFSHISNVFLKSDKIIDNTNELIEDTTQSNDIADENILNVANESSLNNDETIDSDSNINNELNSENNLLESNSDNILESLYETEEIDYITKKKLKFETVNMDYFNNSLFIGDSRMAGFEIYMRIPNAMYFCYSSASVFNIFENEDNVAPIGKTKLFDLLSKHKFDKIYIMLGINNLQTNYYNHKKQYKESIDKIKNLQPQAIIYLIANLHVTDVFDPTKIHLTNENVNLVNAFIKEYADNAQTFYIDPNPMYDDENGNLRLELSYDNIHIHVSHYDKFLVFLLSNALVEDNSVNKYSLGPAG